MNLLPYSILHCHLMKMLIKKCLRRGNHYDGTERKRNEGYAKGPVVQNHRAMSLETTEATIAKSC